MRTGRWAAGLGLLAALLTCGCSSGEPAAVDETASEAERAKQLIVAPSAPLVRFKGSLPVASPSPQPRAAQVASYSPDGTVGEAAVPTSPLTGRIAGQPFICRQATVRPDDENKQPTLWFRFTDRPNDDAADLDLAGITVNLEVPSEPKPGEWTRAMADQPWPNQSAWFTWQPPAVPDATPPLTTGSRYDWACYLKIERLLGPAAAGGVDSLAGRLLLVFDDGPNRSWVGGTFVAAGLPWAP